jgi:hypothetical protein
MNEISMNSTWITSALECLLSDWTCPFMAQYTNSEKV